MSEPLKQYIWEAVPGATSPETASALIMRHLRPITGKDVLEAFRPLGVAAAGALDALTGFITNVAAALREAFDGAKTTTQKDFALA